MNKFASWYYKFMKGGRALGESDAAALMAECESIGEGIVPEDAVESLLHNGHTCALCNGESPNAAQCYAFTDMAHEKPEAHTPAFGMKKGMILPLVIPACNACRRSFRWVESLPTLLVVVVAAIGVVLFSIRSVREPFMDVFTALPVLLFIALFVALPIVLSLLIKRAMLKVMSKRTKMSINTIPQVQILEEAGFVELNATKELSRLTFSVQLPSYIIEASHDAPPLEKDISDNDE